MIMPSSNAFHRDACRREEYHNALLSDIQATPDTHAVATKASLFGHNSPAVHDAPRSTLLTPALANLCTETSLDGLDAASRGAAVALDEVETIFASHQLCVGRFACLARDVFN